MLKETHEKQAVAISKWDKMSAAGTTGTEEGYALIAELTQLQQQIDEANMTIRFKTDQLNEGGSSTGQVNECLKGCGCTQEDLSANLLSIDIVSEDIPIQKGYSTSSLVLAGLASFATGIAATLFGGYLFIQKRQMYFKKNDVGIDYIKL